MLPTLNIFGIAIQTRGLVLLGGFWLGLQAADLAARRLDIEPDDVWNAGFAGLIAGLIGARLFYVIQFYDAYAANMRAALAFNVQDMNWWAGALAAAIAGGLYLWAGQLSLARTADALIIGGAVAWGMAGLSAFFSGDAFGIPTTLPWGIEMWGASRHPVQLYEFVAGIVLAGVLWWLLPRRPFDGWLAIVGVALMAAVRLVVEAFRAQPATIGPGFRITQIGAWLIVLAALAFLEWQRQRTTAEHANPKGFEDL